MNIFLCTILACCVSLLLRIAPIVFLKNVNFNRYHFNDILDLASCCITGQIIYSIAFNNKGLTTLLHNFTLWDVLIIGVICLSFLVCLYTKSIMKAIFFVLIIYTLLITLG